VGLAVELAWRRPPDALARLACCALAALVPVAACAAWALHNRVVYGVPATTELATREFRAACGALQRATPELPHRLVPLPRATRERLYPLSPAFAELRAGFEGRIGQTFERASTALIGELAGRGEIAGGWWMWALREAANEAGWHATGSGALARYAELAREVNAACESGRISCGPPHDSILPPLYASDVGTAAAAALRAAVYVARMEMASAHVPPSRAPPEQLELFRRATHTRTSTPADAWRLGHEGARTRVLDAVARAYRLLVPFLSAAALAVLAWRGRRLAPFSGLVLAALLALLAARFAIVGLVDATSFPAVYPVHLASAYPVWMAFCALALAACARPRESRAS
jgi:hypothetical protein